MAISPTYPPLAAYASDVTHSRGRIIAEPPSPTRTDFHRDRDRIIHSNAFKRLKDKTQVFFAAEGDYLRTRLTHTLEVAQIARALTRALGGDEDLAETLALAHDLGHPPFGHAGEDVLNSLLPFDHNVQTFRVVTQLEKRYAQFDGLNLTYETLEGLVKHNGALANPHRTFLGFSLNLHNQASLEAQAAAIADDIAYNAHDIEDGLRAKLLNFSQLAQTPFTASLLEEVSRLYPILEPKRQIYEISRRAITRMVEDVIRQTKANLAALKPQSCAAIEGHGAMIVHFSPLMQAEIKDLKTFLMRTLYRHETIMAHRETSEKILKDLFHILIKTTTFKDNPRKLCDYLAGMTDTYAHKRHRELTGN